jgi:hypothetical protein
MPGWGAVRAADAWRVLAALPMVLIPIAAVLAQEDDPAEIVADAVRARGFACDPAVAANRDEAASRADEAVWILRCGGGRYRVRFPGDEEPQVERLE